MPIVGGTTESIDPARVSNYSHSTIHTTNTSTLDYTNVPQLTGLWRPPGGCADRWMAPAVVTYISTVEQLDAQVITTRFPPAQQDPTPEPDTVTTEQSSPTSHGYVPLNTDASFGPLDFALPGFVAFSTNPKTQSSDTPYDVSYSACQPYGAPNLYSPGICPDGHTIAEITEFRHTTADSNSTSTIFQGSCCREGMTFGYEMERVCIGNISTQFQFYATFTTTLSEDPTSSITVFEYPARSFVSDGYGSDGYNTTTFSNISTVTSGLIAADPIVVAWQQQDLKVFPTDYVSSLAQRYNTDWIRSIVPGPTPASTATVPQETRQSVQRMSKGEQAGLGVGVSAGAALIIAVAMLILRRRRKRRTTKEETEDFRVPELEGEERKEMHGDDRLQELDYQEINEMPQEDNLQELNSRTVVVIPGSPVELDAPSHLHPTADT